MDVQQLCCHHAAINSSGLSRIEASEFARSLVLAQ